MPLASSDKPCFQYVFILTWKPDGTLAMALFGGSIDVFDFAVAVERALHQVYYLEGASKSFHVDFESRDAVWQTLGIQCVGSCFNCGRLGNDYQKCEGCHFVRYCGKKCQRQHWKAGHRSSCSTVNFDHRRRRRAEHVAVWGVISGYDFDLWVHLAGERALALPQVTHVYSDRNDTFSRVDAAFVALV